jgi:hypothetical protein
MQLSIDGQLHTLIDIKDFRAQFGLPQNFGISYFEPKDYSGLGSVEQAGADLNAVSSQILEAIPRQLDRLALLPLVDSLCSQFRESLYGINDRIRLREDEVEFAVAGFADVLWAVAYALIENRSSGTRVVDFNAIYFGWVNASTRVSSRVHVFDHDASPMNIRVINTAYGRAGLVVDTGDALHYVRDGMLACPAEGFMLHLLHDITNRIMLAVV